MSKQLPLAFEEASRYHEPLLDSGPAFFSWNYRLADPDEHGRRWMQQRCFPVSELEFVIGQIADRPDLRREDHYISQCEFWRRNRRFVSLRCMASLWLDVDLQCSTYDANTADFWTRQFLGSCNLRGLLEPSLIVWSGRGLHAKWVLDQALPRMAYPRWKTSMDYLADRVAHDAADEGWPVDFSALDASRILRVVGTYNSKCGGSVLLTHQGPSYEFDYLCSSILPYSREQVAEFRADAKARKAAQRQWAEWDANRARAAAQGRRIILPGDSYSAVGIQAARELHDHRLMVLRRIAAARGGIPEGLRNEWLWIAANSLAWVCGDAVQLQYEIPALAREMLHNYPAEEARASASSVHRRKTQGRKGLYRMTNATLAARLRLTDDEAEQLVRRLGHERGEEGRLGFEPMRDLSFEEYQTEKRRRQAAGARHATVARKQHGPALDHDQVEKARQLRSDGLSTRAIAAELGVNQSTVVRWFKG